MLSGARGWGGRDDWARRGSVNRDFFRGTRPGRHGGFGRGREGQIPHPGAGRGGQLNPVPSRWVW